MTSGCNFTKQPFFFFPRFISDPKFKFNASDKILMSPGRHFLIPSLAFCMEKRWLLQGSSIQHQRNIELSPLLYVVNNRFLVII
jgi:hypothetical protein